ncbi:MAG: HAMP domain-containing histidine kinase [Spirochaetaceae bacterium]
MLDSYPTHSIENKHNIRFNKLVENQDKSIESEKMRAMIFLVNGISHTMNTPLGVGITASSYIELLLKEVQDILSSKSCCKSLLRDKLDMISTSVDMVQSNLNSAVSLINEIKETAVCKIEDHREQFNLSEYLKNEIEYLGRTDGFTISGHQIKTKIQENLIFNSYPSAFSQIVANLINNSLVHGLKDVTAGVINIDVFSENNRLFLKVGDNGTGMEDTIIKRIFEPFFTTKMGTTYRGLGMTLVYNLVVYKMNGKINCYINENGGLTVEMQFVK